MVSSGFAWYATQRFCDFKIRFPLNPFSHLKFNYDFYDEIIISKSTSQEGIVWGFLKWNLSFLSVMKLFGQFSDKTGQNFAHDNARVNFPKFSSIFVNGVLGFM